MTYYVVDGQRPLEFSEVSVTVNSLAEAKTVIKKFAHTNEEQALSVLTGLSMETTSCYANIRDDNGEIAKQECLLGGVLYLRVKEGLVVKIERSACELKKALISVGASEAMKLENDYTSIKRQD